MSRPFTFRINAAELFTHIQGMNNDEKSAFITQLSIDFITLKPSSEYAKNIIDEAMQFIEKKRQNGLKGGRPKSKTKAKVKLNLSKTKAKAKPETESVTIKDISLYKEIVSDLNAKGNFRFTANNDTIKHINGRLSEGFTKEDFFLVHDIKIAEWQKDEKFSKYLRPSTLYAPSHFESYLNQRPKRKTKTILNMDGVHVEVPDDY